jgi:4a-hydroxytetrahydrobiopterin dehydratase
MSDLNARFCRPCEGKVVPLSEAEARSYLQQVQAWEANETHTEISHVFRFKDHYQTLAFVNAMAWISHRENHHPIAELGYNYCKVRYSTHAINGLSENDFICAAKLDLLVEQP